MNTWGDRSNVAWDIETTGFDWSHEITVSGFWFPDAHATIIVNAPHSLNRPAIERQLSDRSHVPVEVVVAHAEREVLGEMRRVVFDRIERDYNRLVGYNAGSWGGGFDLPFTRTRCIRLGVDWVFDGVVFADLWDPINKRLNTTHTEYGISDSISSLVDAYTVLLTNTDADPHIGDDEYERYAQLQYDPFDESGSAVGHYQRGEIVPVCAHNLADVQRTWELGKLVDEFVPAKDITEKKL